MGIIRKILIDYGFFGPWTWIFALMGKIIPSDKRLVLFGSNHGMHASDNAYALFRHMSNNPGELRPLWITRNREVYEKIHNEFPGNAVMAFSPRGIASYFRTYQVVISHSYLDMCLMPYYSGKVVNYIWHGVPIRKCGKMLKRSESNIAAGFWAHWSRWNRHADHYFASNKYEIKVMKTAFGIDELEFFDTGYPRNDHLIGISNNSIQEEDKEEFVILYAPTYRVLDSGEKPSKVPLLHPDISDDEMHEFLENNDSRLIIRPHPLLPKIEYNSNRIECVSVNEQADISALFEAVDLLVTDYSSTYFDWLILDKSVIFSVYDLDEYSREIGLIEEIENIASGDVVFTKEGLFGALYDSINNPGRMSARRAEIREFIGIQKEESCEQISQLLSKHLL